MVVDMGISSCEKCEIKNRCQ